MSAALELAGVTKAFGAVSALRGIDMIVPSGVVFGLVGPNGAGKTTLFSVACSFLGADKGTVRVCGHDVRPGKPPPPRTVSILPQDAEFMPYISAVSQLRYYAELDGMTGPAARAEAERALALVALTADAGRDPATFSHGMRKRLGIAQAFLGSPRLIILDEPTAGLDPAAATEIRGLIRNSRADRTVIVSSHNLAEVEDLCGEVAILHLGKIVRQDKIESLVGDAAEVTFRLAAEPTEAVLAALRAIDWVSGAAWDGAAGRLRVRIDPKQKRSDEAGRDLVGVLVGKGITFLDMQIGQRLEDRFLEEIRRPHG